MERDSKAGRPIGRFEGWWGLRAIGADARIDVFGAQSYASYLDHAASKAGHLCQKAEDNVAPSTESGLRQALAEPKGPEMKRSRFTEDQIIGILKEHEAGVSVADLFEARRRREPFESSATGTLAQLESNNDQDQTH